MVTLYVHVDDGVPQPLDEQATQRVEVRARINPYPKLLVLDFDLEQHQESENTELHTHAHKDHTHTSHNDTQHSSRAGCIPRRRPIERSSHIPRFRWEHRQHRWVSGTQFRHPCCAHRGRGALQYIPFHHFTCYSRRRHGRGVLERRGRPATVDIAPRSSACTEDIPSPTRAPVGRRALGGAVTVNNGDGR